MLNPPLDLHLGNIGSALPQIADQDPERVMLHLDDYNITIALPVLSAKRNPFLPAYVLAPCNTLTAYYKDIADCEALPQTMLSDFGNSELTLCQCTLLSDHILCSALSRDATSEFRVRGGSLCPRGGFCGVCRGGR